MTRTGMRFYDQEALDLFKKAGASVSDGNLVRIPPHLVERALRTVPKNITVFDRNGQRAMSLGGYRSYFGVGSDCMYIYDVHTGERRQAVLDDVIQGIRLVFVGIETASTVYAVEMASAVAGGLGSLQRHPFIINYVNTTSAFRHNEEAVQRLLYAAERNLPTIYAPGNSRGTTAPMTVAGVMALGNAGQLAGLVLSLFGNRAHPAPHPRGLASNRVRSIRLPPLGCRGGNHLAATSQS
jgi:trimethylamine--corrinoid protein Co-methyltransferase